MFKSRRQKQAVSVVDQSARLKRQSQQLRTDFLNNNLNNLSSHSSHINSSLPEQSSQSSRSNSSNDEQDQSSISSNIKPSPRQPHSYEIGQTEIIRNSKNWQNVCLESGENNSNQEQHTSEAETNKEQKQLAAKIRSAQRKSKDSKLADEEKSAHFSLQIINYKTMLKNQIKRSKKIEQQLINQKQKNNYMAQLIEKLKEENGMLHKLLKKQKQKTQLHSQQQTRTGSKNISKYCECDEKTPSLFTRKQNKLCRSSKVLK